MDVINNNPNMPDYFMSSINREADKRTSQLIAQKVYNKLSDFFSGNGCFQGTFKMQARDGSWPYQASPWRVAMHSRKHSRKTWNGYKNSR